MITVFNVGQGDSLLLEDALELPLLIDCGPSNARISLSIDKFDLLLTHHHSDHMGGFNNLSFDAINNIYLPLYFPELKKIYDVLKRELTKRNNASLSSININKLKKKIILVKEGDNITSNKSILNPPVPPKSIFSSNNSLTLDDALDILKNYIDDLDRSYIEEYIPEDFTLLDSQNDIDYKLMRKKFFHGFFIELAYYLDTKKSISPSSVRKKINRLFKLISNDSSIVLYSKTPCLSLFTGDVGEKILEDIVIKNNIQAKILKVPHHGSKENLNDKILKTLKPTCAIISHKNGRFGSQTDPHPNTEIINMLKLNNVIAHYTNDVIKNNINAIPKTVGKLCCYLQFK